MGRAAGRDAASLTNKVIREGLPEKAACERELGGEEDAGAQESKPSAGT